MVGKLGSSREKIYSDGSKWEPYGSYVYLCSDHFIKVLLLVELAHPWVDLWFL